MKPNKKPMALAAFVTAVLAFAAAWPCAAQNTWNVATTDDDGGEDTLRAALAFAQDGDTILITVPGTIHLNPDPYNGGGPLLVDKSVTIIGPGQDQLTIDGGHLWAPMNQVAPMDDVAPMNGGMPTGATVFWVGFSYGVWTPGVTVSVSGLTIARGAGQVGGGILNAGNLTLRQCTLRENYGEYGGAIGNLGTLALWDCTLDGNVAVTVGGAIFSGDLTWSGATTAATLTRCILTNNVATETGWLYGGGAIANMAVSSTATLSIEDCTLSGNSAQAGGAIYNLSSGNSDAAIPAFAMVGILRSTLSDNSASAEYQALGGAILQATADPIFSLATVTVDRSTLSGNTAVSPNSSSGGAIFNDIWPGGYVVVRNSTLADNSARIPDISIMADPQWAVGGALAGSGTFTVDNSTLSGNVDAGGLFVPAGASGIFLGNGASLTIKNTILANDASGPNLAVMPPDGDLPAATVMDLGYNLCTDGGAGLLLGAGDQLNTNPLLGPLANNGGPTLTCALLPGSPAVHAADSSDSAGEQVTQDQRGISRPQGLANDVGAFEATSALDVTKPTVTSPSAKSPNLIVTVTIANPGQTTAHDVTVTGATLDGVGTKSELPLRYGAIKPGSDKKCTLTFRNVPSGDQTLVVNGTSSLGAFFITQTVDVP